MNCPIVILNKYQYFYNSENSEKDILNTWIHVFKKQDFLFT